MYESEGSLNWNLSSLKKNNAEAKQCVNCNLCVTKCPQGINIPKELLRMRQKFPQME